MAVDMRKKITTRDITKVMAWRLFHMSGAEKRMKAMSPHMSRATYTSWPSHTIHLLWPPAVSCSSTMRS